MASRLCIKSAMGKVLCVLTLCIGFGAVSGGGCTGCCDAEREAMEDAQAAYDAACEAFDAAQEEVAAAQANLDIANANLKKLTDERDNLLLVIQAGHATLDDYERYQGLVDTYIPLAQAAVAAAEARLATAQANLQTAAANKAGAFASLLAAQLAYYNCINGNSSSMAPCGLLPCGSDAVVEESVGGLEWLL